MVDLTIDYFAIDLAERSQEYLRASQDQLVEEVGPGTWVELREGQ